MIKIPFNRCVILTTLNLAQITNRLESAIYIGAASCSENLGSSALPIDRSQSKQPRYFGQIRGFGFLATRIIGNKYVHLPTFLLPTIEGEIDGLYHGYEISLTVKLQNITCALLLICLGGLLVTIFSVPDSILTDRNNYQYLTIGQTAALLYMMVIAYFYFDAWRATKFFRTLFVKRFAGTSQLADFDRQAWSGDLQLQAEIDASGDSLDRQNLPIYWVRKNLPSISTDPGKLS